MDELISRQAVFDALRARFGVDFDYGKWWNSSHVLAALESVPGVETPEPKTGHWVRDTITDLYHCSICRYICRQDPRSKDNYCSYCGARMVDPQEGGREGMTEITTKQFDWNDNLSEEAREDFSTIQQNLSYGIATTIGMALAKLEMLERQGCRVEQESEDKE